MLRGALTNEHGLCPCRLTGRGKVKDMLSRINGEAIKCVVLSHPNRLTVELSTIYRVSSSALGYTFVGFFVNPERNINKPHVAARLDPKQNSQKSVQDGLDFQAIRALSTLRTDVHFNRNALTASEAPSSALNYSSASFLPILRLVSDSG
ncbi:uncharacterized protein BT62DRAFT_1014156 [Guyanagaster necrorhizus]|uniref:Uncharacterized protein n=1 Tax=Guyanagaster necrorhizus TaxID=856835 RepID=A0A9P7VEW4_9AGAR|nr:uncharacterized protein BT62DRAFT_1014156 [Guyanagaster necrorhizus MCA 3950]KAG7439302.1 hypothetical protein BT62DRAFT_1014156 [Guyanagaster necrorhizus MCA 3950]